MSVVSSASARAAEGRQHQRFSSLCIRPARSSDLPRMARMASEIFQHERDIDYFNRYRCARTGLEPGAEVDDAMIAAETEWRLAEMRVNHRSPGRHFIIAAYTRQPNRYLRTRRLTRSKEVILGWAEWQDPGGRAADTPALVDNGGFGSDLTSEKSDGSSYQGDAVVETSGSGFDKLTPLLEAMTLKWHNQALLVPSNGLGINFFDAVDSLKAAASKKPEEWKNWCNQYLPSYLSRNGDIHGRHLNCSGLESPPSPDFKQEGASVCGV
ncbi:hypothetical protein VTH82DRAFT_3230 [Thermothelomyces myriococcoides]